jgi:hypothetical protein
MRIAGGAVVAVIARRRRLIVARISGGVVVVATIAIIAEFVVAVVATIVVSPFGSNVVVAITRRAQIMQPGLNVTQQLRLIGEQDRDQNPPENKPEKSLKHGFLPIDPLTNQKALPACNAGDGGVFPLPMELPGQTQVCNGTDPAIDLWLRGGTQNATIEP